MPRPRLPRLVPRPATASDIAYAIEQAKPMMAAWLSLATFQGLRCMEIAKLRREDVLEDRDPPLLVVSEGKGGHQAVLVLNEQTEKALRGFGLPQRGGVFRQRDGSPYSPATVSRYIGKYLRSLGIDATAHRCRHLYVSLVWAETHDLLVTREAARHADPKTTAGYAKYDDERASEVMRNLRLEGPKRLNLPGDGVPLVPASRSEADELAASLVDVLVGPARPRNGRLGSASGVE